MPRPTSSPKTEIQKAPVLRYVTLKQFHQADEALKRYVALFPEDTFAGRNGEG
jgi:hypothetical protein